MTWKPVAGKAEEREFTEDEAREVGKSIGADFDKYDFKQFHMGLPIEWEHKDTVGGDLDIVGNIVLDHLDEYPDYYTRLKKVETSWKQSGDYVWRPGEQVLIDVQLNAPDDPDSWVPATIVEHHPDQEGEAWDEDDYVVKWQAVPGELQNHVMTDGDTSKVPESWVHQASWHDKDGTLDAVRLARYRDAKGTPEAARELLSYYRRGLGYNMPMAADRAARDLYWIGVTHEASAPLIKTAAQSLKWQSRR